MYIRYPKAFSPGFSPPLFIFQYSLEQLASLGGQPLGLEVEDVIADGEDVAVQLAPWICVNNLFQYDKWWKCLRPTGSRLPVYGCF